MRQEHVLVMRYIMEVVESAPRAKHRKKKRRSAKRVTSAVRMTDERRIQKALASLGFYRGRILMDRLTLLKQDLLLKI